MSYDQALTAIRDGKPVCLYDFPNREAETDVLYIGRSVGGKEVDFIRRVVGGPLAVYVDGQLCDRLQISTFIDMVSQTVSNPTLKRLVHQNHGHDPRFALSLDFRGNRTGCSPAESARTATKLFELASLASTISDTDLRDRFTADFVSPGHVPIIKIATSFDERTGHAELSAALARHVGVPVFVVAGELIDPDTLESMSHERALRFAGNYALPFVTGEQILNAIGGV